MHLLQLREERASKPFLFQISTAQTYTIRKKTFKFKLGRNKSWWTSWKLANYLKYFCWLALIWCLLTRSLFTGYNNNIVNNNNLNNSNNSFTNNSTATAATTSTATSTATSASTSTSPNTVVNGSERLLGPLPAKFIRATRVVPRTLAPQWNEKFRLWVVFCHQSVTSLGSCCSAVVEHTLQEPNSWG